MKRELMFKTGGIYQILPDDSGAQPRHAPCKTLNTEK